MREFRLCFVPRFVAADAIAVMMVRKGIETGLAM
jgi:hypothetical protein